MAALSESGLLLQGIRYQKPGDYIREALCEPSLNPFLVRVRSRDRSLGSGISSSHRQTVIWVHDSLRPLLEIKHIPKFRRLQTEPRNIFEHLQVIFTNHSGLQKGPREFERETERMRRLLA